MLFNSYVFWIFLAIVIILYRLLPHKGQNRMLLVASYLFYGYWDWRFLSLIFLSTVVDYFVAQNIIKHKDLKIKKRFLIISIFTNLGLLGFFKYFNFFTSELISFFDLLGLSISFPLINVILPVGISFYTFQTMSYTIDVYRGHTKPTKNFLDFALYVSFFPQLVAGPIERSTNLMPQILSVRSSNSNNFSEGFYFILKGLFKKVVIADNMAPIVNMIFAKELNELSGLEVLIGLYAFAFQIYGDFAGYSSIAKGVAKWMGFDLMWNFKLPYFAKTPSEFWQRWHISLSSWLRDYLFLPVAYSTVRKINKPKLLNIKSETWAYSVGMVITMFLGGLWHGAGWTFINWGLFHGLLLVIYRMIEQAGKKKKKYKKSNFSHLLKVVILFHLICISWLLFRAENMTQVWNMLLLMFTDFHMTKFAWYSLGMIVFYIGPWLVVEIFIERSKDMLILTKIHWSLRGVLYSYMLMMLWIFPPLERQVFIYFQF